MTTQTADFLLLDLAFLDSTAAPLPSPPVCVTRPPAAARAMSAPRRSAPGGRRGRGAANAAGAARPKFQCHLCTSTFSRKDNLKTHQRLHSGEMPFQCKFCGRKFRWQSSARTHEQVHERHGHQPRADLAAAAAATEASRRAPHPAPRAPSSSVKVENVVPVMAPFSAATLPYPARAYETPRLFPTAASLPATAALPVTAAERHYAASPYVAPVPSMAPRAYPTSAIAGPRAYAMHPEPPAPQPRHLPTSLPALSTVASLPRPGGVPLHTAAPLSRRRGRGGVVPAIRKQRQAAGLLLDFPEDVMGDVGAALSSSIAGGADSAQTPQAPHGESPMFNVGVNMSHQDIEECMDPHQPDPHHHQPPPS